jgi:O-antigen/teichoic acid export membrane protein
LLAQVTLAIFFTGAMEWGWKGAAAATFVSCFILAMYAFYYCKEEGLLVNSISKKILWKEIKNNLPLAAMKAGLFCTAACSVYFIAYFTGDMAQVAVFSVTAAIASVILLLCSFMFKYSYPKIQSLLNNRVVNYAAVRWHLMLYAGVVMLGCVVAVIIIPVVYDMLPGQTYQAGLFYYMFICMGYFFGALAFMMQSLLLCNRQIKTLFRLSVISIATTVLLNMLFTKLLGTFGAAVAIYAANCIILLISILAAKKHLAAIFSSYPSKNSML